MVFYDPMAAKFANRPLDAWQVSEKKFDFDAGFVKWIQKYLEARKVVFDVLAAKQWINGAKFDEKRYEDCSLQWEGYQESIKPKPVLKAVVADPIQSGGIGDLACKSTADRDDDAVMPELPHEFARLEGESGDEYVARMMRISREKIKSIGNW